MKHWIVLGIVALLGGSALAAPNQEVLDRYKQLKAKNPGHIRTDPGVEINPVLRPKNVCTVIVKPFPGWQVFGIYLLPSKGSPAYDPLMLDTDPNWVVPFKWVAIGGADSLSVRIQTDGAIDDNYEMALNGTNQLAVTCKTGNETHVCTPYTPDDVTLEYQCN